MAATYQVVFLNDAGPTETVITNARFRSDDANTADLTNPCIIDTSVRYSYWKHIALKVNGTFTQVSNIRHYSAGDLDDWTYGTTGAVLRGARDTGDQGCPDANYEQATGTPGVTGDQIATDHAFYSGQVTPTADVNDDVAGSPATISTTAITVAGTRSKGVVMQVKVDTDAVQGVMATKTLTFKVDEI